MAQGVDFKELAMRQEITWEDLKKIDWDSVPVKGSHDHLTYSRLVAGWVRNYDQFYTAAERSYAMALERWLTQYSMAHTHSSLR